MLDEKQHIAIADELAQAEKDRSMVPLLTARFPEMSIEDSYAVQVLQVEQIERRFGGLVAKTAS